MKPECNFGQLAEGDLTDFQETCRPGVLLDGLLHDAEFMRFWRVTHEQGDILWIVHGTGAVARLTQRKGRIVEVHLMTKEEALSFHGKHGFQIDKVTRKKVREYLQKNAVVSEILQLPWCGTYWRELFPEALQNGGERRRLQIPYGGIVEFDVAGNGRLIDLRFITGHAALTLFLSFLETRDFMAEPYPGNPVEVRTPAELELFLLVQRAYTVLRSRWRNNLQEVLAYVPEGRMVFAFRIQDPDCEDPFELGPGTSLALDPVKLVLFADRVAGEAPVSGAASDPKIRARHAKHLQMAAAGLRQTLRFFPENSVLLPTWAFSSKMHEKLAKQHPEAYHPSRLLEHAELLELVANDYLFMGEKPPRTHRT